jgi:hypothetical protein
MGKKKPNYYGKNSYHKNTHPAEIYLLSQFMCSTKASQFIFLFFSLPIHIPSVLFLFRINPENDQNISISFTAIGGIKWTQNPVKALGIFFGHNQEECQKGTRK